MGTFVTVGKASAVAPGTMATFRIGEKAITVANVGGTFFAFDDTCTHRGCSLGEGELDEGSVICPCHGGTFEVNTGKNIAGPPRFPIDTYRVQVVGDDLVIET